MAPTKSTLTVETLMAHGEWLRRLAACLLHGDSDAEDVVQESWEAALRSPPDPGRPIRPWLSQVLRNVIRSSRRGALRRASRERASEVERDTPTAEELLERVRLQERIARLLSELEEPFRTTLLLRFHESRSAADIARASGVAAGTVRWRISEGVRRLRERLDQQPGQGRTWRAILAPLAPSRGAGPPGSRPPASPPLPWTSWLVAGAGAAVIAYGASTMVMARRPEGQARGRQAAAVVATAKAGSTDTRSQAPQRAELVSRNARAAASLVGVAVPALLAAAEQRTFTGKRVDLDFKDANIKHILRLLSQVGGVDIWTADDVSGRVTVKVKNVPWDQVLDQICEEQGLTWQRTDNSIFISRKRRE